MSRRYLLGLFVLGTPFGVAAEHFHSVGGCILGYGAAALGLLGLVADLLSS